MDYKPGYEHLIEYSTLLKHSKFNKSRIII